jgi:hypothetical protein
MNGWSSGFVALPSVLAAAVMAAACSSHGGVQQGVAGHTDAPYFSNLLSNPNADLGDLRGWDQGTDSPRWWATPHGFRLPAISAAIRSGTWTNTLHQRVDLVARGFSAAVLDRSPPIFASQSMANVACGDVHGLQVKLLDAGGGVLSQWSAPPMGGAGACGTADKTVGHVFMGYPAGVRYVDWSISATHSNRDEGHTGVVMKHAHVSVAAPNLPLSTCAQPQQDVAYVDLLSEGVSPASLDRAAPIVLARQFTGGTCYGSGWTRVELLDQDHNVLASQSLDAASSCIQLSDGTAQSWHMLRDYPPGARLLRVNLDAPPVVAATREMDTASSARASEAAYVGVIERNDHDVMHTAFDHAFDGSSSGDDSTIAFREAPFKGQVSFAAAACGGARESPCKHLAWTCVMPIVNVFAAFSGSCPSLHCHDGFQLSGGVCRCPDGKMAPYGATECHDELPATCAAALPEDPGQNNTSPAPPPGISVMPRSEPPIAGEFDAVPAGSLPAQLPRGEGMAKAVDPGAADGSGAAPPAVALRPPGVVPGQIPGYSWWQYGLQRALCAGSYLAAIAWPAIRNFALGGDHLYWRHFHWVDPGPNDPSVQQGFVPGLWYYEFAQDSGDTLLRLVNYAIHWGNHWVNPNNGYDVYEAQLTTGEGAVLPIGWHWDNAVGEFVDTANYRVVIDTVRQTIVSMYPRRP